MYTSQLTFDHSSVSNKGQMFLFKSCRFKFLWLIISISSIAGQYVDVKPWEESGLSELRASLECRNHVGCLLSHQCSDQECEDLTSHHCEGNNCLMKNAELPLSEAFSTNKDIESPNTFSHAEPIFLQERKILSMVSTVEAVLSKSFNNWDLSKLKSKQKKLLSDLKNDRSTMKRYLEPLEGTLGGSSASRSDILKRDDRKIISGSECTKDTDCLNRFGKCENGICRGFLPDFSDERLIRCVDGYRCDIKEGEIPGIEIGTDMQLIAISPAEKCGAVNPLQSSESIFANSNRWQCEEGDRDSCVFGAGVGQRQNKSISIEGVRLCGCPSIDGDGSGESCDNRREFFVPLGRLSVQECIKNAHCIDHGMASCVYDHCSGFTGIAASAGLKIFQCIISRDCNLRTLTGRTVNEAMKILPLAANFKCGSHTALDPDVIDDSALPCLIDINDDGVCDVNLGVAKALGTTRLCGCRGDRGGNGRDCDQIEDFDDELGLVNVGECIIDMDCGTRDICVDGRCLEDRLPPYVQSSRPGNESYAVPPVNEITLLWNENIKFTTAGRKLVIASADANNPVKWEMEVRDPKTYKIAEAGYAITIKGREMKIIPDVGMASFAEGKYIIGFEGGIVSDLQDNYNHGAIDIIFSISNSAGCPFLYTTGFSAVETNPNGLYTPVEPINGRAAWRGGAHEPLYIYWKEKDVNKNQPGNWIISTKTDERHFIGYADLKMMEKLGPAGEIRPPDGVWKKWEGEQWTEHPDITMTCKATLDRTFPKLIQIHPKIGARAVEINGTRVMMKLSKPVTYGHWATIQFVARGREHNVTIIPDFEGGMRGINIKSDMRGVVELNLEGLENLLPGTTYDIVAGLGSLTDLSYNPWGPVGPGILYFTTFGVSCSEFSDLGPAYKSEGNGTSSGDTFIVSCADGYSSPPPSSKETAENVAATTGAEDEEYLDLDDVPKDFDKELPERRVVRCVDGRWDDIELLCFADCPPYYELGRQYQVEGSTQSSRHGTTLNVTCAKDTILLEGSHQGALISCNDGKWTNLLLKCGTTCGPFPSLGANYRVTQDDDSFVSGESSMIGSRRIISCASPAKASVGAEPEQVVCEETGWSQMKLQCHVSCSDLSPYGEEFNVVGDGNEHAQTRNITCSSGYKAGYSKPDNAVVICVEGRWQQSVDLQCQKDCGPFGRGPGYKVVEKSGEYGSHGSTIEVSCLEIAKQESGGASEILKCDNGGWELGQIVCNAPCASPEITLGGGYVSEIDQSKKAPASETYDHGTTGYLYCAASTSIMAGISPEMIICANGNWISALNDPMASKGSSSMGQQQRPNLVCENTCGPFSKDKARYLDEGGDKAMSVLEQRPASSRDNRTITCGPGYSPQHTSLKKGTLTCTDGKWTEQEGQEFVCLSVCSEHVISDLFSKNYDLVVPTKMSVAHGEEFLIKCRNGFSKRVGTDDTAIVKCFDGRLILPEFVCSPPTCYDGIQNGEEEFVDCGGDCPTACTPCQLQQRKCLVGTCRDKVKNDDEENIDCGGSRCAPCQYCNGPPKEMKRGMMIAMKGGQNVYLYEEAQKANYITGSKIDILCAHGYEQLSDVPSNRIQSFECLSRPMMHWQATDGSRSFVLDCAKPQCDDKVQNGDELGIDCGGSCPNKCPSCNDGIKNGDEESIDCGGSRCLACKRCGIGSFKNLNSDLVFIKATLDNEERTITNLWDIYGTRHGNKRHIACRRPTDTSMTLQCDNGIWRSTHGVPTIHQMICEDGPVVTATKEHLIAPQFRSFRIPTIPIVDGCANMMMNDDGGLNNNHQGGASAGAAGAAAGAGAGAGCCTLIPQLLEFLSSECGALLFGSRSHQLRGFCKGTCNEQLKNLIDSHDRREGLGCQAVPILKQMKEVFCFTGNKPPTTTLSNEEGLDYYCFASAGDTLSQMKNLNLLTGQALMAACDPNSCFSSNLRYFELLRELTLLSLSDQALSDQKRNLRDSNNNNDEWNQLNSASYKKWATLVSRLTEAFSIAILQNATELKEGYHVPTNSTLDRNRRQLQATSAFLASSASSTALYQLVSESRYSRNLLKFMCLTDASKNQCGSIVQQIVSNNMGKTDYFGVDRDRRRSPKSTTANLVFMLVSNPCGDKCLLELIRHLGQELINRGKLKVDPYLSMLGLLMRAHGRVACQKSTGGLNCGDLISANFIDAGSRFTGIANERIISEKTKKYPLCSCPIMYVGDGQCDTSCFSPDCNYDEEDCTFKNMFPAIQARLDQPLSLEDACHPFNSNFYCSRSNSAQHGDSICRDSLKHVIEADGCCAATRWEMVREIFKLEVTMRHLAAAHHQKTTGRKNEVHSPQLNLDRSTRWIESSCQVSLDRGCSRGLRRPVIQLSFVIEQLDYLKITSDIIMSGESNLSGQSLSTQLMHLIRDSISDALAIPIADILEIRFWSGSIVAEVVIDSGNLTPEVLKELKTLTQGNVLSQRINSAVVLFLQSNGILPAKLLTPKKRILGEEATDEKLLKGEQFVKAVNFELRTSQFPALSLTKPPPPPITGSLDMGELASSLQNPSCPTSLGFSPPPDFSASSELSVYVMDSAYGSATSHGATRRIHCADGFEPSFDNSGQSPQLLICDRGRWIPIVNGEPKLICRRPCQQFEDANGVTSSTTEMSIVAKGGVRDGATRTLLCVAGSHPVEGGKSPEILKCRNGVWDRRSLECTKGENSNQILMKATCGRLQISNYLKPNDYYVLKQIQSGTIDAMDFQMIRQPGVKAPTKVTLWSIRCTRGYVADRGVLEPIPLFCVNNTLLVSNTFAVNDWEKPSPQGGGTNDVAARESQIEAKQSEILHLYYTLKAGTGLGAGSIVSEINQNNPFTTLQCVADVRTPPQVLSSQPGLPQGLFYTIIFTSVFVAIAALMLAYYLIRTQCLKHPFLDQHHHENSTPHRSHQSDLGHCKNKESDLHITAVDSRPSSPTSDSRESESWGGQHIMQGNVRIRSAVSSFESRRSSIRSFESIQAIGFDDPHSLQETSPHIDNTIRHLGQGERFSSNDLNRDYYHQSSFESEDMDESQSDTSKIYHSHKNASYDHSSNNNRNSRMNQRSHYCNLPLKGPSELSFANDQSPEQYAARRQYASHRMEAHQTRPELCRSKYVDQLVRNSSSEGIDAMRKKSTNLHIHDTENGSEPESSALESGASFYSELDVDTQKLKKFYQEYPEMNQQILKNLKSWSQRYPSRESSKKTEPNKENVVHDTESGNKHQIIKDINTAKNDRSTKLSSRI